MYALIVITLIALLFVFIGQVNTLGPIVTMPFMLTYATVDYAYFALAMSAERRKAWEARFQQIPGGEGHKAQEPNGTVSPQGEKTATNYGSIGTKKSTGDLDKLFPERTEHRRDRQDSLGSPTFVADPSAPTKTSTSEPALETEDTANLIKKDLSK